ncbi:MAG TPA: hypothetical protein VN085_07225 [Vicinamibacterales bacterium]|nr:hypothetical protein [Vicinamibacterales bacterium]
MTRTFDLGDILSITDGRLVSPRHMEGVYDILDFMTGDSLSTIGLLSAMPPCRKALLEQHPQLSAITKDGELTPETVPTWLAEQKARYGEQLPVVPLASWTPRSIVDDILDVNRMNPDARVFVVEP